MEGVERSQGGKRKHLEVLDLSIRLTPVMVSQVYICQNLSDFIF